MNKIILTLASVILILASLYFITAFHFNSFEKTSSMPFTHTYTKAFCDESNFCQDYEIICKGKELIKTNTITGATIQQEKDWEDPRTKSQIKKLCD